MTRSGRAYPLESSGHRTCESGSGSWPTPHGMPKRGAASESGPERQRARAGGQREPSGETFPTPTETDARKGYASAPGPENRRGRQTLSGAVQSRLWPTPKASPSGPDFARAKRPRSGGDDLPTAVAREELWPTPNAADGKGGSDQPRRGDPERAAAVRCQGAADLAGGGEARGSGRRLPASEGWSAEPDVGRVADGVPARVDRLAALGNALLPQIAEWIGRRILEYEAAAREEAMS